MLSWKELWTVYLGVVAAIGFFSWLPALWPPLGEYSAALVAASFIYLPAWVVWRRGATLGGGRLGGVGVVSPRWRDWGWAAVTMAIVFPLFAAGFLAYEGLLFGHRPCVEWTRLYCWPEQLLADGPEQGGEGLWLYKTGAEELVLVNGGKGECTVDVEGVGVLQRGAGGEGEEALSLRLEAGRAWRIPPGVGPAALEVVGSDCGERLRLGAFGSEALPHRVERGLGWILYLLFVHLVLIALPEEIFFRGYLQSTLQRLLGRRWVLWGGDVGPAVLLTSALFALSHLAAIPAAGRLAVFFPSLLFGWLRDRTGSVVAPILVHGCSNVLLQVVGRWVC